MPLVQHCEQLANRERFRVGDLAQQKKKLGPSSDRRLLTPSTIARLIKVSDDMLR